LLAPIINHRCRLGAYWCGSLKRRRLVKFLRYVHLCLALGMVSLCHYIVASGTKQSQHRGFSNGRFSRTSAWCAPTLGDIWFSQWKWASVMLNRNGLLVRGCLASGTVSHANLIGFFWVVSSILAYPSRITSLISGKPMATRRFQASTGMCRCGMYLERCFFDS